MSPSTGERERLLQARRMGGPPFDLPWTSFAGFFTSRVSDPGLAGRTFLSYHDDDRHVHRRYSYAEFGDRVGRAVTLLRDRLRLRRGDRVATVLFNHDETVIIYFAAWALGVAVVPINVEEPIEKKRYILEHSEASVVFCWQDYLEEIEGLRSQVPSLREVVVVGEEPRPGFGRLFSDELAESRPDVALSGGSLSDEALIVYTSGTTGPPKGVILTAENLLIDADGIADWHGFGPDDRLMCVLPIHHVNGMVVTLVTPFYFRGGAVLNRKFKTAAFWRRLEDEKVTCVSVVPTLLEFLLEANEDIAPYTLDRFRGLICGAGPLLKETAARFEERFGFPIRHGYGLSETTCYSCFLPNDLPLDEHRRWLTGYEFPSIGLPLRHNEMAILDERGREVEESARGEICIRGRTVCAGYFKRPDANEAAFQWGWFRSGDEGFYIRDGQGRPFLFISGRIKELIIRGGVNISPLEIDDILKGHPSVKFAMAVPFENRYYGEEIAAYVVPKDDAEPPTEAGLLEFCRGRLPFAKRPKVIVFGRDVPYTATGKPKRLELKARLSSALASYRDVQFKDR
jgi:long-chain acyl-CoA synthetase